MKPLLKIAAPGIALVLPAGILLSHSPGSPVLDEAARGYPYVALAAAALLAWCFRRSRVAAAVAALAAAHLLGGAVVDAAAETSAATSTGMTGSLVVLALAPLFAALAFTADRRLGAPRALIQIASAPLLVLVAAAALYLDRDAVETALARDFLSPLTSLAGNLAPLPQAALAGAATGLTVLAGLALYRRHPMDSALFWAALAGTLAFLPSAGPSRGVWMLSAGLVLCLGVIEASHALAFRDELTGLPGRRTLTDLLSSVRPPYAVAIVDIDRFKSFNDRHGHDVGDQVLRMVATKLASVGGGGRTFRSGGEEFTIVFPGRTGDQAYPHLDAVRKAVADSEFTVRGPARPPGARGARKRNRGSWRRKRQRLRVTVSIGVASYGKGHRSADEVVLSADKAMYRAKQKGRNRVVA